LCEEKQLLLNIIFAADKYIMNKTGGNSRHIDLNNQSATEKGLEKIKIIFNNL
jgi:hypothetical protein